MFNSHANREVNCSQCTFTLYIISHICQFTITGHLPLTSVVSVDLVVLFEVWASCRESSDALDTLDSNRSTFHISHKCTVSLQCELAGELSVQMLWSNFFHRLSRGEAALWCESRGASGGGRTVKTTSRTDHSGSSSLQCASTRVF